MFLPPQSPPFPTLVLPLCLRDGQTAGQSNCSSQPEQQSKEALSHQRALLCARCHHPITTNGRAISINGHHRHTFPNPLGLVFEIRCFEAAPGCRNHGTPTAEFSWFLGYLWQYALCSRCHTHLGWRFLGNSDSFFGLIETSLVERDLPH